MRLELSGNACEHVGSGRCERCFPRILDMEKEGGCILRQIDDGAEMLTLVMVKDGEEKTYLLSPEKIDLLKGESWEEMMEALKEFEVED